MDMSDTIPPVPTPEVRKKRGRKPNGGKIIAKPVELPSNAGFHPVVILHLKCKLQDLNQETKPGGGSTYEPYNTDQPLYNVITNEDYDEPVTRSITDIVDDNPLINAKLNELEYNLHNNTVNDKKSACFHCTYPFDNTQFYIPKCCMHTGYKVYGCFCSPECAVSYLFTEHLDAAVKVDRYAMLNHMYGSSTNYTKNIKPAPNPYYTLSRFYGNLTIQEYRSLFKKDRLFMLVDKPISRCMPEVYEDTDRGFITQSTNGTAPGLSYGKYKHLDCKPSSLLKNNIFTTMP
jgi:hypothetical protein